VEASPIGEDASFDRRRRSFLDERDRQVEVRACFGAVPFDEMKEVRERDQSKGRLLSVAGIEEYKK